MLIRLAGEPSQPISVWQHEGGGGVGHRPSSVSLLSGTAPRSRSPAADTMSSLPGTSIKSKFWTFSIPIFYHGQVSGKFQTFAGIGMTHFAVIRL